jgi:hypothetical protein
MIEFVALVLLAWIVLLIALMLLRLGTGLEDREAARGSRLPPCPPTLLSAFARRACGLCVRREEAEQCADSPVDNEDHIPA